MCACGVLFGSEFAFLSGFRPAGHVAYLSLCAFRAVGCHWVLGVSERTRGAWKLAVQAGLRQDSSEARGVTRCSVLLVDVLLLDARLASLPCFLDAWLPCFLASLLPCFLASFGFGFCKSLMEAHACLVQGWSRFGAQRGQLAAPWIAADLGDRLVVAKPPHWEVHDGGTSRQLLRPKDQLFCFFLFTLTPWISSRVSQ